LLLFLSYLQEVLLLKYLPVADLIEICDQLSLLVLFHSDQETELEEELDYILSQYLLAFVLQCEECPHVLKQCQVIFESLEHIVGFEIVLLELLDCNQNKQVKHDESLDCLKCNEEELAV
jgi:hypothetical protein